MATEYNPGKPLERYSAERRRRGTATEGAAYHGAGGAAATAGMLVGNAKIAGTQLGQQSLDRVGGHLKHAGVTSAAPQIKRVKDAGKLAARHRTKTTALIGGLSVAAAGLHTLGRMRNDETTGISQGIGRIKAGESYAGTRKRVLAKSLLRTAAMSSDTRSLTPKMRAALAFANRNAKTIGVSTLAAGGATGTVASVRAGRNRVAGAKDLRHQAVTKAMTPKDMLHWGTALGGGSLAGGAVVHQKTKSHKTAAAAVGGGLAAQGAYQHSVYHHNAKVDTETGARLKRSELTAIISGKAPAGKLKPEYADKKGWEQRSTIARQHRAKHQNPDGSTNWKTAHRSYPDSLPHAKAVRRFAYTHSGKTGMAVGTAATAAGAGLAGSLANRGNTKGTKVAKALYSQESRPSLLHYAGMGIGGGLAAWGLGRSGMLGSALGRGVKAATARGNTNALEALRMAQATQGLLARGTAPGERGVRQIRALNTAINRVPAAMRPEIAAASGIYLMGNSAPLNRTSYRQVSTPYGRSF